MEPCVAEGRHSLLPSNEPESIVIYTYIARKEYTTRKERIKKFGVWSKLERYNGRNTHFGEHLCLI